ncbi:MAG TPA: hypothetical protein VM487_24010 [Phycisphaerae bacterium]|nr:hypothetical protein [Phycisphaerae bacterium]
MSVGPRVGSDEIILKRIPSQRLGSPEMTIARPGIGLTATSFAICPRRDEKHPSWSRQRDEASAEVLLRVEAEKGRDISGWRVAAVEVRIVRDELGLDVVANPTEEDPGHCLIVPTSQQPFTDKIWSQLAKRTRIIYTHPAR